MLVGPTLLGKSTFIRHRLHFAGLRHAYFQGQWALDEWDQSVDVIVFDDVKFQYIRNRKQFWGCQKDYIIDDKYRTKRKIGGGIPLIYICNPEDDFDNARREEDGRPVLTQAAAGWYEGNTLRVIIQNKMFV